MEIVLVLVAGALAYGTAQSLPLDRMGHASGLLTLYGVLVLYFAVAVAIHSLIGSDNSLWAMYAMSFAAIATLHLQRERLRGSAVAKWTEALLLLGALGAYIVIDPSRFN